MNTKLDPDDIYNKTLQSITTSTNIIDGANIDIYFTSSDAVYVSVFQISYSRNDLLVLSYYDKFVRYGLSHYDTALKLSINYKEIYKYQHMSTEEKFQYELITPHNEIFVMKCVIVLEDLLHTEYKEYCNSIDKLSKM